MDRSSLTRRRLLANATAVGGITGIGIVTAGPDPTFEARVPQSGTWPLPRYGPRNTAFNPHADPPRTAPAVAWSAAVPGAKALVVAGGTVFAGDDGRSRKGEAGVVALDATTGKKRWRTSVEAASLCVHDGTVYGISGRDGTVTALKVKTGERRWQTKNTASAGHFVLAGANALYTGLHGRLGVYDFDTGESKWERNIGGLGPVGAGIAHRKLYVGGPGPAFAFEPRSGLDALLYDSPRTDWKVDRSAAAFGFAPALADNAVFLGGRHATETQTVTAYDAATGDTSWTGRPLGNVVSTPAISGRYGYAGVGRSGDDMKAGSVVAFDLRTGAVRWRHPLDTIATPPIVANHTVYGGTYADNAATVYALDRAVGELLWKRHVNEEPTLASVGRTLYVGTEDGSVVALRRR